MQNEYPWHSQAAEEVAAKLEVDTTAGLLASELPERQAKYGLNKVTEHKGDRAIKRFLLQFHQPLVYILLAATAVTLALQEWVDSAVILAVVFANAIIGFVQEAKVLNAINSLSGSLQTVVTVIRDGKRDTVTAEALVPGDLAVLQAGDKASADMRLIKMRDLQIDESALTGESVASEKQPATLAEDSVLEDRRNMAYSSTLVTYGSGLGLVTATGDATEIGKISTLIATTQTLDTPLTKRIKQFSHVLLYAIVTLSAITVFVGWLHGKPMIDAFLAAVALAVGAIPEGLPAAVTIMLAIGVSRMAKRRAIIRNLPAVETLGSTTVICSDKTGTLTKNEMTVKELWGGGQYLAATGSGYDPDGEIQLGGQSAELNQNKAARETLQAGLYCNESNLHVPDAEESQWRIGRELAQLQAADWPALANERKVFARVTPESKLALVEALQSQGHVVAMTGDGVNDAPALRRADIGVAMALNGTEVVREAADMMLTDDNFATVRSAVEEGRGVFDNLKKFIVWTLPTNGGEGLVVLLAVLLGISLPLLPAHILWVNLTTAIFLGLMLAFEPKEAGIMQRPPNKPDAPILDGVLLWRILLVSSLLCLTAFGLYELELLWGATETEARTVAVAMFVVGEAFYLLNCRSLQRSVFAVGLFSNLWIWWGIGAMSILQLAFTYLPIMNYWFKTVPIGLDYWLRILACGAFISFVVGLEKHWRQHRQASNQKAQLAKSAGA